MAFDSIKRIMPKAIEAMHITPQMEAVRILQLFGPVLASFWDETRAAYLEPVSFSHGALRLRVKSGVAKQEFKLIEVEVQNALNRQLGGKYIKTFELL